MVVELSAALSSLPKLGSPDPDELSSCETVTDIIQLIGAKEIAKAETKTEKKKIPEPLAVPMKQALLAGHSSEHYMDKDFERR